MNEYNCQIASSFTSSQSNVNILSFAIAFLKELNSRTIIEYFLNLAYVNMMLERKFINYVVKPNKVFNLHSRIPRFCYTTRPTNLSKRDCLFPKRTDNRTAFGTMDWSFRAALSI